MQRKSNKKIIVILLLVSVILSFCFLITHYNHKCTHADDCPVCVLIHQTADNLLLGLGMSSLIIVNFVFWFKILFLYSKLYLDKTKETLIGLKVQMNN